MIGLGSKGNGLYKLQIKDTNLKAKVPTQNLDNQAIPQTQDDPSNTGHTTNFVHHSCSNHFGIPKSDL